MQIINGFLYYCFKDLGCHKYIKLDKILDITWNASSKICSIHFDSQDDSRIEIPWADSENVLKLILNSKHAHLLPHMSSPYQLSDLDLTVRTWNILKAEGINSIEKLQSWCNHRLLYLPNMGVKSHAELMQALNEKNIILSSRPQYISHDCATKCSRCEDDAITLTASA